MKPNVTPTKNKGSSRSEKSISPPRSAPPKPLSRVTIKQDMLHKNDISPYDITEDKENTSESLLTTNQVQLKDESSQNTRISFSGLDPKRLEKHLKRPTSAPMRKKAEGENVKIQRDEDTKSSVDLREYYLFLIRR